MPNTRENKPKLLFVGDNQLQGLTSTVFQKKAALRIDSSRAACLAIIMLAYEILTEIPVQPNLICLFFFLVMSVLV